MGKEFLLLFKHELLSNLGLSHVRNPHKRLHRQSNESLAQLSDSDRNLLSALQYRAAMWWQGREQRTSHNGGIRRPGKWLAACVFPLTARTKRRYPHGFYFPFPFSCPGTCCWGEEGMLRFCSCDGTLVGTLNNVGALAIPSPRVLTAKASPHRKWTSASHILLLCKY